MRYGVRVGAMLGLLVGCARGTTLGFDDSAGAFGTLPDAVAPCVNLECRQARCDGRRDGGASTTLSAYVYDPAGVTPLYNVIAYVPNGPLEPFANGASCERCGSVLSGRPLTMALSDTHGHFVLTNVPSGDDVPLVLQIGKWRRRITLPRIEPCRENTFDDRELFRLPRSQHEGEVPRIAVTTGCDPLECLLRKIGIDDAEFTAENGPGRVHLYRGVGGSGFPDSTDAYEFWSRRDNLAKYDVVVSACECRPYFRGASAYAAMARYLDDGGRFFGSHYHYNWFTDRPSEASAALDFTPGGECNTGPNLVDDSFPKGRAMAEWLVVTGASDTYGRIPLSCAPLDVARTKAQLAQAWIYDVPTGAPSYVSFNAPVVPDVAHPACGRAVFADLHVSDTRESGSAVFPSECNAGGLSPQELALEFMFFDLASCVLDDSAPPEVPPIK